MRQKGSIFERFVKKFFQIEPTYANQFEQVWLWNEFPYRNGMPDTGIDIVTKIRNREEYCAIQCKFYSEDSSVSKADVDTFLSASSTYFQANGQISFFTQRIIVSTTDKWSSNAESTILNQMIPVNRIRLQDFEGMAIDWDQFDINNIEGMKRSAIKHLLDHQKRALKDVVEGFANNDRGKLIMACGTGKTFTSLKIVEEMTKGKGNVIFFVPSISLLNQTLVEWSEQSAYSYNMLAICSDSNASKKNSDEILDTIIPATTDSKKLIEHYNSFNKEQITFFFSTYQSIDVVSKFQKESGIVFDVCVCDEAHRTTGVTLAEEDESSFTKVHSNENINAKKRLYMTATPKVYGDESKNKADEAGAEICSMDDESKYGPEFHRLGFGKAVQLGLLSDYKVIVLTVSEEYVHRSLQKLLADKNNELNLDDSVKIIGCWNGLSKITCYEEDMESFKSDPEPMRTSVAFCNTIANSKAFKQKFEMIETYYKINDVTDKRVDIDIEHVDGKMNSLERKQKLEWLKASNENGRCRILTNARCLSEGIDVPALDSVMFLSPRNSIIDIIQSVGRVMRRPYDGNKKYGYIILPIGIPAGVEPDKALNDNKKYKVVWDVLQALRAHDDRFNNTINKIDLNKRKPDNIQVIGVGYGDGEDNQESQEDNKNKAYKKLSLDLDMEVLKDQVYAKIVKKCGSKIYWENWAKDVADIANRHITQIKVLLEQPENKKIFDNFVNSLRSILNPSITNEDAIEMLAEHLITKPVFDALFDNYSFVKSNSVSKTMQEMLDLLDKNSIEKDQKTLEKFYDSVRERAKGVDNSLGKQKIVIELYDKFFRVALKKQVEKLGIVYTPTEVVDFIIHSVEKLINREFGKSLADKDVHILDPFTGTGTFIVRLIQSGIISKDDILYKYTSEIHANEIVLLAYYIAAVNIEEALSIISMSVKINEIINELPEYEEI
ncbi:MAG: DEAD/DEAH box helicase [Acholeplasmatales bacterium]|nr:DEAD/DEAH box helicase [Acholeplasmatales bacterium]